ncbi:FAD-dependent monooxygenase [Streptomyces fuscigenes]|uniref:FAD-dependent monooxygenase n=1 Tax=Streptomyces fuscigenes TaxID=1528880 RepID=UPI001F3BB9FB|nr:FAD-dependent monooxygenase [Streptomyces fuscigenes]MCF3960691.1 FAD-dependent monooxygenase [Streptomyces fuscigenes]
MTDVLIAGAGPTGLTAGCVLARRGLSVRIVRKHRPFTGHSRASVIWPRALHVMESIGAVDPLVAIGSRVTKVGYYSSGESIGRFELGRLRNTRFTFALGVSQHETEAVLESVFRAAGGEIADAEIVGLEQDDRQVTARLVELGRETRWSGRWLVGADGANSTVRDLLGITMDDVGPGVSFRIADAVVGGLPEDEASYCWTPGGGMAIGPHDRRAYRLAYRLTPDAPDASPDSFQRLLDARGPKRSRGVVRELVSTADFQARFAVARNFSAGRCHLAGDSAHVMAPAGGQGMNSGILDADALARRMVESRRNGASENRLAGYGAERRDAIGKIMATAVEHARDGGLRSDSDIAARDRRYRGMWNDSALHRDRMARLSQLDVDPIRTEGAITA